MVVAPVSKTGGPRFESWLPRSEVALRFSTSDPEKSWLPVLVDARITGYAARVGVDLRCVDCGARAVSALFWRGPGQHSCTECGGQLVLDSSADERRQGVDRRRRRFLKRWPDWRGGTDRRATVPESSVTEIAS